MRGVKRTAPLYLLCQRDGCGNYRVVQKPHEQRIGKYCSRRCAALVHQNIRQAHRTGAHRLGVLESARRRKAAVLARVVGLTPLEAFRVGYRCGIESKCAQIRKRYLLVRKSA